MKKVFASILVGFAAVACTPIAHEIDRELFSVNDISIELPKELTVRPSADNEKYIDNSGENFDLDNPHEYRIHIHFPEKQICQFLGASAERTIQNKNTSAIWGKVDFWSNREHVMDLQNEYPTCRPPSGGVAYAFCAEKDGKAVAICIQQRTDDEEMAKQIFESFRWID